eukprot:scaffold158462_cov15-Tisochrysis_lutea.AAC.1
MAKSIGPISRAEPGEKGKGKTTPANRPRGSQVKAGLRAGVEAIAKPEPADQHWKRGRGLSNNKANAKQADTGCMHQGAFPDWIAGRWRAGEG